MRTPPVKIDLRVPSAAKAALVKLAEAEGRSLNSYLNRVLAEHVRAVTK